jgi:hypothetical protein
MHPRLALGAFAGLTACAILLAAPAEAQDEGGDRVNQVIIYGDDECPQSDADTITVCARMDESERFRIPERLRQSGDPANQAWTEKVKAFEAVGDFGPMSCTPIGAGGELGCTAEMIEAAFAERAQGSEVRFGQLISEAREERLSEIDEEAAATQARVEELERAYMERIRREQEGEPASDVDASTPPTEIVDPARVPPAPPAQPLEDEEDRGSAPIDAGAPGQLGATP